MIVPTPAASSAGSAAIAAPAAASGVILFAVRFHTLTLCPTFIRRVAIAEPMRPRPATPMFIEAPSPLAPARPQL
jgi:hypothetical protein